MPKRNIEILDRVVRVLAPFFSTLLPVENRKRTTNEHASLPCLRSTFLSRALLCQYEMYFQSPSATIAGDIDATFLAQLGNSAVAGDWKVDIYNRATDEWEPMGADSTLSGGKLS